MALQEKYAALIAKAHELNVAGLSVAEQDGMLHIAGTANSTADYDTLWALYNQLDPAGSGDVVMNVDIRAEQGAQLQVTTDSSSLNLRNSPSTEGEVVAKAAHGEVVTLLEKTDDSWWRVRTADGEEGYAFAQYLSPM